MAEPKGAHRSAGVYLQPGVLLIHAQNRTVTRFAIAAKPVFRLLPSASNSLIGRFLRDALAAFRDNVATQAYWAEARAAFLKATGFRSWRALEGGAKSCWIEAEGEVITLTPLQNGGTKGRQKGFQPFGRSPTKIPVNVSDEELGSTLMKVLEECE